MTIEHFIVSQRDSVWQFSFRGDVTAPFTSKDSALKAAIAAAGQVGDTDVAVLLRDGDLHTETVWRSGGAGLTSGEAERLATDAERETDA